jgi:hypothetical protein
MPVEQQQEEQLKQQLEQEEQEEPAAAVAMDQEDGHAVAVGGAVGCMEASDDIAPAGSAAEAAAVAEPVSGPTPAGAAEAAEVAQLGCDSSQVVQQRYEGPAQGVRVVLLYPGQTCVVTSQ